MKKTITLLLLVLIITTSTLFLSSCSANDTKIQYDVDNHVIYISTPISNINNTYESLALPDMLSVSTKDNLANIKIDVKKYTGDENDKFVEDLKSGMSLLIPSISSALDLMHLEITKDFYGTSMAGTTYYKFVISLSNDITFPVEFVSTTPFMLNGKGSTRNDDGTHILVDNISIYSAPTTFDLQSSLVNFTEAKVAIDISTSAPLIEYTLRHNSKDLDALKRELVAMGFAVDFCDNQQVVFSDKYNNVDDFFYVFPMRNFSMIGVVTTAEGNYGSFFSDNMRLNMTLSPPEHEVPIIIIINSQNDTNFEITLNEKTSKTSNTIQFELTEQTVIHAEYNNFNMFDSITSLLAILAIIAIILLMLYIAIKK